MTQARTPVIIGVGQYTDRLDSPQYRGLSSVELAVEAAGCACRDARDDARLVAQIDGIGALRTFEDSIPRYSTPFGKSDNFPHSIARRLGATARTAVWPRSAATRRRRSSANSASALQRAKCGSR